MTAFLLANRDACSPSLRGDRSIDLTPTPLLKERGSELFVFPLSFRRGGRGGGHAGNSARSVPGDLGGSRSRVLVEGDGRVLGADHRLLLQLAGAGEVGVREARGEQPDGPDGVVVARERAV